LSERSLRSCYAYLHENCPSIWDDRLELRHTRSCRINISTCYQLAGENWKHLVRIIANRLIRRLQPQSRLWSGTQHAIDKHLGRWRQDCLSVSNLLRELGISRRSDGTSISCRKWPSSSIRLRLSYFNDQGYQAARSSKSPLTYHASARCFASQISVAIIAQTPTSQLSRSATRIYEPVIRLQHSLIHADFPVLCLDPTHPGYVWRNLVTARDTQSPVQACGFMARRVFMGSSSNCEH
jgi:hypothetical protein